MKPKQGEKGNSQDLVPCPLPRGTSVPCLGICVPICHPSPSPSLPCCPRLEKSLKFDAARVLSQLRGPRHLSGALCDGRNTGWGCARASKDQRLCFQPSCFINFFGMGDCWFSCLKADAWWSQISHGHFSCCQRTWHSWVLCLLTHQPPNQGDCLSSAY